MSNFHRVKCIDGFIIVYDQGKLMRGVRSQQVSGVTVLGNQVQLRQEVMDHFSITEDQLMDQLNDDLHFGSVVRSVLSDSVRLVHDPVTPDKYYLRDNQKGYFLPVYGDEVPEYLQLLTSLQTHDATRRAQLFDEHCCETNADPCGEPELCGEDGCRVRVPHECEICGKEFEATYTRVAWTD